MKTDNNDEIIDNRIDSSDDNIIISSCFESENGNSETNIGNKWITIENDTLDKCNLDMCVERKQD